ncbi:IclR family transcriptional regulator [Govanella unica]|uniref:IclR family transcriptional regulator n=1 Tax=Govanella unica TaxID=2975056 RepID=A0A9X3TWY1_9PROT|nr:IclR family transcriptional regulator [Govania unica]MDA5193273.1 IclR family transcriptional regulator [Govania unica]
MTAAARPLRKGIQSIEIGYSILAVLMQSARPLPLKTISQQSGLSPSKAHSYLVTFCALEMVVQHQDSGSYALGPAALRLGLGYLDQFDLFTATRPAMSTLAEDIGATIFLGVWGNRGPTIVYRVDGPFSQALFDLRVGSVLPLLRSAVGRNLAAHLPSNIVKPFITAELDQLRPTAEAEDSIDNPQTLGTVDRMLDAVRKDGISRCRGGLMSDFTALSVPIFDFSGGIHGALTVMGRLNHFDDSLDGRPATLLKATCQSISSSCGYSQANPA